MKSFPLPKSIRSVTKSYRLLIYLIVFVVVTSLRAQPPDTLFYSVVKGAEISGSQKIWMNGPHEFHSSYQFNDRGRGDSVTATITTDDSGLVVGVETNGIDYFKRPFHESFEIIKDSAIIVSNDERKSKLFKGELFQSAEPTDIEPVTQYLIRHENEKLTLINGGTMMMLPPHEKTVSFQGKMLTLRLCEFYYNENTPPTSSGSAMITISSHLPLIGSAR